MILFCGYANIDVVARVPLLPGDGSRVQADMIEYHHGGMGANAAVAAARAGSRSVFGGAVGSSAQDRAFLQELSLSGVDTSWCHTDSAVSTAVVLVTPDGERAVISQDDGLDADRISAGVTRLARSGGWLYLDGYRWPEAARVLRSHDPDRRLRLFVDLDGCDDADDARVALDAAHHAVVGLSQLRSLFRAGVDELPSLAAEHDLVLVVTDGARGWWMGDPAGRVVHGSATPVRAEDATGAGDCFSGVYVAGLDQGLEPVESARRAAVAAALSCTVPGARGAPALAEVEAVLSRTPASPDRSSPIRSTP